VKFRSKEERKKERKKERKRDFSMEKYQTPAICVSKELSMNVKSEDITFNM
jgi:hypothetical protein